MAVHQCNFYNVLNIEVADNKLQHQHNINECDMFYGRFVGQNPPQNPPNIEYRICIFI